MNLSVFVSVLSIVVAATTGCASVAQGPTFLEGKSQIQPSGMATVYVYRNYAEPTAWGSTIFFGEKEVATLNQGGFTWMHTPPGRLQVRGVWAGLSGQQNSDINLDVEAGKTYYVELLGTSRLAGYTLGTKELIFKVGSGFRELSSDVAVPAITSCCKLQKTASPQS